MPVVRTYRCPDCQYQFDKFHGSREEAYPDCPACAGEVVWQPTSIAIRTHKSAAVDIAQQMAEQDYGLTDINDNQRAGDIAAKAPSPIQTSEAEAIIRAQLGYMAPEYLATQPQMAPGAQPSGFMGGGSQITSQPQSTANPMAIAAPAAAEARGMDRATKALLSSAHRHDRLYTPITPVKGKA